MFEGITSYKQYIKELLALAFPLFVGNLGHNLIGATDVLVIAKYSVNSLAAVSIANSIFFSILVFGIGILVAISIILANFRGDKIRIKRYLLPTIVLSCIVSIVFSTIYCSTKYIIPHINLETELVPYIQEYISIVSFSMFGIFLFEGIRQFLQSYEIVKFPNYILLVTVVLNLIADIIFVFGFGIIPEMGTKGAAIATLIIRTVMGIVMILYVLKFVNKKDKIDFVYMKNVLKTGLPIGIALLLEFLAFNIITVLAGQQSSLLAAVHSILITMGSITFMIPMAISTALSVKIAYYFGANKPKEIKKYTFCAFGLVLLVMVGISLILAMFPKEIISVFTNDEHVLKTAIPLISILAAYQIFDGIQAVTGGILKGFKHTKTVSLTVLAGYWLVGAPIAYFLVVKYDMSLRGYWIALAISLFSMGFIQSAIAKHYYKSFCRENLISTGE